MSGAEDQLKERYAYSPVGTRAVVREWVISGSILSVVALYSPRGFLRGRFFLNNINHHSVKLFLKNDLSALIADDTVTLVDNASIPKESSTLALLEEVTRGRYAFASAYSNRLKPIERGFANVLWRTHERSKWAFMDCC